ncbi:hypothetical protein D3C86_1100780 [compost metagenome]
MSETRRDVEADRALRVDVDVAGVDLGDITPRSGRVVIRRPWRNQFAHGARGAELVRLFIVALAQNAARPQCRDLTVHRDIEVVDSHAQRHEARCPDNSQRKRF